MTSAPVPVCGDGVLGAPEQCDDAGNVLWTQGIVGAGGVRDMTMAIAVDGNDDLAVAGQIRTMANNDGDIWVAKLAGSR